jgi:hypothetical protein
MIEVQPKTRDIPVWLTGLVLILCVIGGGWLVRWYTRDGGAQTVDVPLESPAAAAAAAKFRGPLAGYAPNGGRPQRAGQPGGGTGDGVRSAGRGNDAWSVRAGEATMYVALNRRGQLDLSPSYVRQALTPEQAQVLLMRRRLLMDPSAREQVKLTESQLEALKKVDDFRGMVMDAADRAKLGQLFEAWRTAPGDKTAAERALVAGLAETAKRCAAPTKAFDAGRVEQVKKILTPEQVKRFNEGLVPAVPGAAPPQPQPAPPAPKPVAGKAVNAPPATGTPPIRG